jgi:hypothetical protein
VRRIAELPTGHIDMSKNAQIVAAVMTRYIETGKHSFITDLMAEFGTNAAKVNAALSGGDFDFFPADRETGHWYDRRTVAAPAVEPSKAALRQALVQTKYRLLMAGSAA